MKLQYLYKLVIYIRLHLFSLLAINVHEFILISSTINRETHSWKNEFFCKDVDLKIIDNKDIWISTLHHRQFHDSFNAGSHQLKWSLGHRYFSLLNFSYRSVCKHRIYWGANKFKYPVNTWLLIKQQTLVYIAYLLPLQWILRSFVFYKHVLSVQTVFRWSLFKVSIHLELNIRVSMAENEWTTGYFSIFKNILTMRYEIVKDICLQPSG